MHIDVPGGSLSVIWTVAGRYCLFPDELACWGRQAMQGLAPALAQALLASQDTLVMLSLNAPRDQGM